MIELRNLEFINRIKYPNLVIQKNKMTFIQGPSGKGKSSLIKMINNTVSPSNGDILFNNQNILDINPLTLRKELMLVSQNVYLFDKSIKGNFIEYYKYLGKPAISEAEMKKYLDLVLAPFDINQKATTLSGGEKQRVYLAIYLSFKAPCYLLDEPTSALDEQTSNSLFKNLKTIENTTFVVVSHDKSLAKTYGDEVIELGGEHE